MLNGTFEWSFGQLQIKETCSGQYKNRVLFNQTRFDLSNGVRQFMGLNGAFEDSKFIETPTCSSQMDWFRSTQKIAHLILKERIDYFLATSLGPGKTHQFSAFVS